MEELTIRKAERKDLGLLMEFLRGLAEYEHAEDRLLVTEEILDEWFFTDRCMEAVFLETEQQTAGFASFYYTYSTFSGKKSLFIEDLFVKPEFRGKGYGKALLSYAEKKAAGESCQSLTWECLAWNKPSQQFYHNFGAKADTEWIKYIK